MDIENNDYIANQIKNVKDKKSKVIDLSWLGLTKIPDEIFEINDLDSLVLGNSLFRFDSHPGILRKAPFRSPNKIIEFDERMLKWKTSLRTLDISNLDLEQFPKFVFSLINLRELHVSNNKMDAISSDIQSLSRLENFIAMNNKISEVSDEISKLSLLKYVNFRANEIHAIPYALSKLKLDILSIGHNAIKDMSVLSDLKTLRTLGMDCCGLTMFPKEVLGLKNVRRLILGGRGFIPSELKPNIKVNHITTIPKEIVSMTSLRQLGIDPRDITNLDPNIIKPDKHSSFTDARPIKNYFHELSGEKEKLNELKLIFVGEGRVGKTTIIEALTSAEYAFSGRESTEGIDVTKWIIPKEDLAIEKDFNINVWDFGGQEIYYSTHQFFLTQRSLYILVTESRKEDSYNVLFYWFNILKLLGGESPIIFVLNKIDQPTKELPVAQLREKFKNLISFEKVSCVPDKIETISGLKNKIIEIIKNKTLLGHIGEELPKSWVAIREDIDELKQKGKKYILLEEYMTICLKQGLSGDRALWLSSYLHDLGAILHFKDDLYLKNTIFLNHNWVTGAVYRVLDCQDVKDSKGIFGYPLVLKLWNDAEYERKAPELLQLMQKFEVCFPLKKGQYLAPELLPVDDQKLELNSFCEEKGTLKFRYQYKFMPKGVLTRLILKRHNYVHEKYYWKHGVLLQYEDNFALVREKLLESSIEIEIKGKEKREFLDIIRSTIKEINLDFANLEVKEMVPCCCKQCQEELTPHFFDFDVLRKFQHKEIQDVRCELSADTISLYDLLYGVFYANPIRIFNSTLIDCARKLQCNHKALKKGDEDTLNKYVADLLEAKGYTVKDQTKQGQSESAKSYGEIDFKIGIDRSTPNEFQGDFICEAFILQSLDRTVIDKHLGKLYGYDPNGSPNIFVLVYSEFKHFHELWLKYCDHVKDKDYTYEYISQEDQSDKIKSTDIRQLDVVYRRENSLVTIHHVFVNMNH